MGRAVSLEKAFWISRLGGGLAAAEMFGGSPMEALLSRAIADIYPTVTVSGNPITFADGAKNQPVESCVVEMSPVQDLTYGSPYPAGGGKNLFNENGEYEANKFISSTGVKRTNTVEPYTNLYSQHIPVTPGETYTISGESEAAGTIRVVFYSSDDTFISRILTETITNPTTTFTAVENAEYILINPDVVDAVRKDS